MIDLVPAFDWRDFIGATEPEPEPPPGPDDFFDALPDGWAKRDTTAPTPPTWGETYHADRLEVTGFVAGRAYLRPAPAEADFQLIVKMRRDVGGHMYGPIAVDDAGDGVIGSWYSSPASWLTLRSTGWGYSGGFTQGATESTPTGVHWLRLTKSGTSYTTAYSLNGIAWSAETPALTWTGTPTKVGIGCILAAGPPTMTLYTFEPGLEVEDPDPDPEPETGWVINDDLSSALLSFTVATGRDGVNEKVAPVQVSVVLGATRAGECPEIGRRFRVSLDPDVATGLGFSEPDERARFTGEVTDATIEPERGIYTITGVGRLGRTRRRTVDGSDWPVEDDGDRVDRILALAAPGAVVVVDGGTAQLITPPEPAEVGQLLDLVADSTLGQLVEQPDGGLHWHDADHRRGADPVLTLAASQIDSAIRWQQSVGDVLNEVTVSYGNADGAIRVADPFSIDLFEAYAQSVTTALRDASDAQALGSLLVGRRSRPAWQLPLLLLDLTSERISDELIATLLALRHGDLVTLTGIPAGSPYPSEVDVYVEGITEAAAYLGGGRYEWRLTLAVSDPLLSGVAIRWTDVDAEIAWNEVDAGLNWLDLATVTESAQLT